MTVNTLAHRLKIALLFLISVTAVAEEPDLDALASRIKNDLATAKSAQAAGDRYLWDGPFSDWDAVKKQVSEALAKARATQAGLKAALEGADKKSREKFDLAAHFLLRTIEALAETDRRITLSRAMREELKATAKLEARHVAKAESETCMGYYLKTVKSGMASSPVSCSQPTGSGLRSSVSPAEALDLFNFLREKARIPFFAVDSGCFARAHGAAYLLERKGVYSRKIFIEGELRMKTPWASTGEANWWFHVAPLVSVDFPGVGPVEMVFDPSLSSCPLTVEQWTGLMTRQKCRRVAPRAGKSIIDESERKCEYFTTERFPFNITTDVSAKTQWRPNYFAEMHDQFTTYRKLEAELVKKNAEKKK